MEYRLFKELLTKKLLGNISPDEERQLQNYIQENAHRQAFVDAFEGEQGFSDAYRQYASVNAHKAFQRFKRQHLQPRRGSIAPLRYAAAVAVLAAFGVAAWLWQAQPAPQKLAFTPDSSTVVQIQKSAAVGRQSAVLTVGGKLQGSISSHTLYAQHIENAEETLPETSACKLQTRSGKEFWLTLEDGTQVHMNYNTTLVYPLHFADNERRVFLQGEAYFSVASMRNRPFIVETANGEVKEYGTRFNVNTNHNKTEVVLVEGSISVRNKQTECMLKPGQKADVSAHAGVNITQVDVSTYIAWHSGNFYFSNCSLADLMKVVHDWYGYDVAYADTDLQNIRFNVYIDKYGEIDPLLNAIRKLGNLNITKQNNTLMIKRNE